MGEEDAHVIFEIQNCSIDPPPAQQHHINGVDLFISRKLI